MQSPGYQIISKKDSRELAKFLAKEGQFSLPMLELIEQAQTAVDEVIDVVGRSAIEAILLLSAQQTAGPQHKGRSVGDKDRCQWPTEVFTVEFDFNEVFKTT